MSFKLSELLNPAPSSAPASAQSHINLPQIASDASSQDVETHSSGQLPTPTPFHAPELDLSSLHSSATNHVEPVEPSNPLEHGSLSPTLDQYHLSPAQTQARRHSIVNAPELPLPTLAPIQIPYDVSPPAARLESLDEYNVAANNLPGMHPTGAEPTRDDAILQTPLVQDAPTQNTTGTSQGEIGEDAPMPGYSTSEKEIAALGLAALDGALNGTLDGTLDGVQDGALDGSQDAAQEKEDLAVKTEAQGAADLSTVPSSKPAGRSHKVSTSKPSEGSSDKRFLCYICIKLFTRRRSVRDHIKKIHNDTNFDMARAIEVTVDPETGESVIPLAELVKTLPPASVGEDVPATTSGQASRASSVETNTFSTPAPVAGKKRPAPDTTPAQATALKKKGTAKPRPLNTSVKKAKSEIDSSTEAATVFRSPSGTPVSARASKPPVSAKVKKQPSMSVASSPAPSDRMSIAPADDNEVEDEGEQPDVPAAEAGENEADDENEVFCICRKGDNHTWMIGCDGGCEDWFHGKCVNIQERDGDLIDKYICPNCEDKGRGQTTWKRMCRRKECRKPARVLAEPPSKYCTDDCKKRFWVSMVKKSDPNALVSEDGLVVIGSKVHQRNQEKKKRKHKMAREDEEYNDTNNDEESDYQEGGTKLSPSLKKKKKKKKSISPTMTKSRKKDSLGEDALSSDEEPPLSTKGGALSIGDIKMMLNQAKTVDEIRQLGQKPPTPPYTSDADMDDPDTKMADGVNHDSQHDQNPFPYNSEEHAHLQRLSARKRQLRDRLQLLRDQEKLLAMIAARSFALVEDLDVPKAKNVCGFDARLSWSTAEFEDWRGSLAGRLALEKGEIGDPDSGTESVVKDERPDNVMVNGVGNEIEEDENDDDENDGEGEGDGCSTRRTLLRGICIRNKCPRHREWRRLLASEYKFEEEVVRRQMRKMEAEGKEIRERAAMRVLCEQE